MEFRVREAFRYGLREVERTLELEMFLHMDFRVRGISGQGIQRVREDLRARRVLRRGLGEVERI